MEENIENKHFKTENFDETSDKDEKYEHWLFE